MIPDKMRQFLSSGAKRAVLTVGMGGILCAAAVPAIAVVSSTPNTTPSFNGTVLATVYSGTTLYVAGDFTAAIVNGKQVARTRFAAVNAKTGALLPWAPRADARVKALAVSNGSVYAAGDFGLVNGQKRDSLARLDAASGALHSTFKHSIGGKPYALAAGNGRLYLGGAITSVNGQTRTRLAAFNLSTGALDGTWRPAADDQVEALTVAGSRVYVGGKFHAIAGVRGYDRLAALNYSTGKVDTGFKSRATYIAYGIAVTSTGVYAVHGGQGGRATAYTTSGGQRWTATFDGDGQAIVAVGDTVYVGGHFDKACRSARTGAQGVCLDGADVRVKLAAFNNSTGKLLPWTAHGNGVEGVLTMATLGGKVAAGGAFTTINGKSQKRLVQFG
ncbi:PQQ-like beta-propeller repeat protein [Spirilliplanes yamanashiensis]|uniref:Uncharacterized protein n=1 Tax=Spirilliplanes yamanashiensis TaxID=42233 RepID=A0A8J3Y5R1_9ACTN|nr:PQQ-like beta-propeller repeat protein [Spirilliplanes yamanashiensis]MDP9814688.1 hypothetical protein [Spirilliplanes yamanashiensis]GIJ02341.1 hypothetical protein Sya03_16930 [Spirilliplanes yamanashiensis]